MKKLALFALLFVATFLFFSCEKEKSGLIDPKVTGPFITSTFLRDATLNLDTTTSGAVTRLPNGLYQITDSFAVHVTDDNGLQSITQVTYGVYLPGSTDYVVAGQLNRGNTDSSGVTYNGRISFVIGHNGVGAYKVEAVASDQFNLSSNAASVSLIIATRSSPPVLGYPTIRMYTPPGSDSTRFTFTIFASDTNGLNSILSVTVKAHNATDSLPKPLFDNGLSENGDQFPGDGIFSNIIWVIPTTTLPEVQFEFVATDTKGNKSNIVWQTLVNHPPRFVRVVVPDSIKRPSSGIQLIPFYATVADSDGLGDIDSVYFRNFSSTSPQNFPMYDDGNLLAHGDSIANDGTYSRIVSIDPATTLGPKEFHFFVVDKFGSSDMLVRIIKIY